MATKKATAEKKPAAKAKSERSDAAVKAAADKGQTSVKPDKKAPAKKEPKPEPAKKESPFPPLPDAKLSGPPFKFDGNNACTNPKIHTILLGDKLAVHLAVCERSGTFFHNFRMDMAPHGAEKASSYGTLLPFGGTDSTFGVKSEASARYEAARSALDASATLSLPKLILKELEDAVAKLTPGILKMAAGESMLTVYDGKKASEYMLALSENATAHHSGLILNAQMDGAAFEAIGGALDHVGQKSKWMRGDWYIYGMANHKKQLEALLSDEQRQTIENEAVTCRAFAHDERREHLSFSHHQEAAVVKNKAARSKWLDKAEAAPWSAKKLRAEIAAAKGPAELTNGENKGPGGNDAGAGTGDLTPGGGTTPTGDQTPGGDTNASAGGATKSEYAEPTGGGTDPEPEPEPVKSQSVIDNEAYDALTTHLDAAQTLIRAKVLLSPHVSQNKVRQAKTLVAKIMEDANAAK